MQFFVLLAALPVVLELLARLGYGLVLVSQGFPQAGGPPQGFANGLFADGTARCEQLVEGAGRHATAPREGRGALGSNCWELGHRSGGRGQPLRVGVLYSAVAESRGCFGAALISPLRGISALRWRRGGV